MNQGPGLSERNWLTEGCHPCAWKMMDTICKLLLYLSALYLLCHLLLNKVEILQLLKNKWFGWHFAGYFVGLLEPIEAPCDFSDGRLDYYYELCFPILLSVSLRGHQQNVTVNLKRKWKYTSGASKILAFACYSDNILFLSMLGLSGKGIQCEGMEQRNRKIHFTINKETLKSASLHLS